MSKAICPGSFNPVTKGHLDVFERCARLFDRVVVVVMHNTAKRYAVSSMQRVDWIRKVTAHLPNLEVDSYSGLLADFAHKEKADFLVKGIRNHSDLVGESQMYYANRELLHGEVDTLFLPTREQFVYLSSSLVRDIASHSGDITPFVPEQIAAEIAAAYR